MEARDDENLFSSMSVMTGFGANLTTAARSLEALLAALHIITQEGTL